MEYNCDEGHITLQRGNFFITTDSDGVQIGKPVDASSDNEAALRTGLCPVCDRWAFGHVA